MNKIIAATEDLQTIVNGLGYIWKKELGFIFHDKEKIKNVIIISYDSTYLYIFKHKDNPVGILSEEKFATSLSDYYLLKKPHNIQLKRGDLLGWAAGFLLNDRFSQDKIIKFPNFNVPTLQIISGPLITQFLSAQKEKSKTMPLNPYVTRESYLATIVHEFGHAYFNNYHNWLYSNKNENVNFLQKALDLYKGSKNVEISQISFPNYDNRLTILGEIFAFCTDYSASLIFWKKHKEDIDQRNIIEISKLLSVESDKDLYRENSVLDPDPGAHNAAMVFGKILVEKFPYTWPEILINENRLKI